ncbi:MAG: septum formation initiator family protein [Myxococcales bacterium]|nr:septum formation initiator family protein [Myxococcales bacterium]
MASSPARWTFRVACAAVIAGALGYIPVRVYGSDGYVHHRRLDGDVTALRQQNKGWRARNDQLRQEILRLRDSLDAVEAVARDEFGMIAPGEIVLELDGGLRGRK